MKSEVFNSGNVIRCDGGRLLLLTYLIMKPGLLRDEIVKHVVLLVEVKVMEPIQQTIYGRRAVQVLWTVASSQAPCCQEIERQS